MVKGDGPRAKEADQTRPQSAAEPDLQLATNDNTKIRRSSRAVDEDFGE